MLINADNEHFLISRLEKRKEDFLFRQLNLPSGGIDFSSNDYLGLARSAKLSEKIHSFIQQGDFPNGATGSRLLSGNSLLFEETEKQIASFHKSEAALIFNSGYDANLGFFSCVPQKGDIIFYDELVHASIRDGVRLSHADSYSFPHNSIDGLKQKINTVLANKNEAGQIFISVESIYSMDGDSAPLKELADFCALQNYFLIVDEAHSNGICGDRGEGLVVSLGLENKCFARLYTFGKALGIHGAAILGSTELKDYLVNFCRPFIYTTALPPHSMASIKCAYEMLPSLNEERKRVYQLSTLFSELMNLENKDISPVRTIIIPGNDEVRNGAKKIQKKGFDIRPILSPTVAKGKERLRICLHAFNTEEEVRNLCGEIKTLL